MTKIRPPWLKYLTVDELYTQLEHELLQFQAPTGSGCTLTADQRGTRVTWSPVLPQFEAMQSVKTLPLANQNFITHFRNWLHLSNLGSVVRLVYSHVARLAFSLLQRDWRGIDPKNDLAQVETHIRTNCDDARGLSHLINGLTAFGQYLVVRQQRSLLPGGKLAHMQWPETQPHNPFNDCLGDSPQHDSPISGCVPPKNIPKRSGSRYCRLPRMVRAALAVNKLNLVPLADWPSANQFFYQHFRNWLRASGYGDSAQYLYGLAARIAFSLIKKDWRDIDPTQDLTQVRTWISQHYDSVDTQHTYFKGLAKLADYLQRRQHRQHRQHRSLSAPVQAPNPRPYSPTKPNLITVAALPNPIRRSLEGYLAHCQRNWPSVQSAELGIRDRRQEMSRDWWSRITLPLRQMQTMGLPIASPADLTPTVWYAYVDARLANGIAQSTLVDALEIVGK